MTAPTTIKRSVLEMYLAHPFPQWTTEERHRRLGAELARYRFLGLEGLMRSGRFLDVGCGTGNRSMLIAQRLGVSEFVGFDHSTASLDVARSVAREEGFDRFTPQEGDLFALPFPDGSFDVVVSWGVLHHTHDPLAGFREMVRVCRPGGSVAIFLYNLYSHWRHNRQKAEVDRRAGDDFERRFQVAHELYGVKPLAEMTPEEIVEFYDKYCHPHKSDHTLGETLRWFDELGLEYQGSYPPLRFGDFVAYLRYRGHLLREHPARGRLNQLLGRVAAVFPEPGAPPRAFRRPGPVHRFVWQAFWAWQGRYGEYSIGASLSARKPER